MIVIEHTPYVLFSEIGGEYQARGVYSLYRDKIIPIRLFHNNWYNKLNSNTNERDIVDILLKYMIHIRGNFNVSRSYL